MQPPAQGHRPTARTGLVLAIVAAAVVVIGGGTTTAVLLTHDGSTASGSPSVTSGPRSLVVRLSAHIPPLEMDVILTALHSHAGVRAVTFYASDQPGSPAEAQGHDSYLVQLTDPSAANGITAAVRGLTGVDAVVPRAPWNEAGLR